MFLIARVLTSFPLVVLLFSIVVFSQGEQPDEKSIVVSVTDETAVKSIVTRFFNHYPTKDISAISPLWSEKSPYFRTHQRDLEKIFAVTQLIEMKTLTFGKITVEGENIKVRADVEFNAVEAKTGIPFEIYESKNRLIVLVKEENLWKIIRHTSAEEDLALRLVKTKGEEPRSQLLKAEKDLTNVFLARALREQGDLLDGRVPASEVLDIYRLGLKVAEQIGDKTEMGNALNNIGIAISGKDKNQALEAYRQGIKLSEEIGDKDLLARISGNIASVYFDLGDFDKSLDYSQRSLAAAEEIGDKRLIANSLGTIGNTYNIQGNYLKSSEYHQKSLAIREQINDISGVAFSLNNIGLVQAAQGNYLQAKESFERSLELVRNRGAVQFYNLGNVYKLQGDFAKAMNAYQKALNLCEEYRSNGCLAAVSINVGDLYRSQGNYEQASNYLNRALAAFEKSGDKRGEATALGGVAQIHQSQEQYQKAVEFRKKALVLFEEIGHKSEVIHNLNEIGKLYYALGDLTQASDYFQKSLKINESLGDNESLSSTFLFIADIQLSKGDYTNALKNAEQAEFYHEKLVGVADNWELYSVLGQAYQGLGQPAAARQNFEKAVSVIENLRTNIAGSEEERQRFLGDKISAYDLIINLLISQNNFGEAFAYAERTKSRALLDVLQNGKVDFAKAMTAQEKEREQGLKNELISLNAQIFKENGRREANKTRLSDLQSQLEKKRLDFEDFQTRLYVAHPELQIHRGEMKPISMKESAALLSDDKSALLEYVVTEDKTFLFVLTKEQTKTVGLKVYPVKIKRKDLAQKIESFRTKLANGYLDFAEESRDLYNLLLKPAEAELKGKTNLIIVPDSVLWDLPFQALQHLQNKYLIESAAVSYAPSLTALREMSKKNKNKTTSSATLLAFGNPSVGRETSEKIKRVFMSEQLESLPEAERLVNSLGQMYGADRSRVFTGADAREEIAKTESPKYRIVQFAAHGILNDINPMYSHIVLSQRENNSMEDGLLEAWEMKDLNLNADMVILSACETARGRFGSGEGVIGMSWSLFIAGTPTTVASQWKVESSSTTELMLEFHRQLLTGKEISKAEALRRASLKLLKMPKYRHPSYWAGFVIVGDGF